MPAAVTKAERTFHGTPVSDGVVRGVVRAIGGRFEEPRFRLIPKDWVEMELDCFRQALEKTRSELERLIAGLNGDGDRHAREIIEMQLMVLEDSTVSEQVQRLIREERSCAEHAYYRIAKECMEALARIKDAYLRERALDIKDVAQRVLRYLTGGHRDEHLDDEPAVCIAHDLTPSETAQLDRKKVLGFAVELGSRTSHTAIVARSLGLPAVVRLHGITEHLHPGDDVLLDGDEGLLILNPTEATLARYQAREALADERDAKILAGCAQPAVTLDGRRITVGANMEFVDELEQLQECGAEGVGLFRTEFLYLENPEISEERLTAAYSAVVQASAPHVVIFRTLDLGGDKLDPAFLGEEEQNPFLGWRGIRVSLAKREVFKRQLRAILRASLHGPIGIMYPMISGVGEVLQANGLLDECVAELASNGVTLVHPVQRGAMIEIPGAAAIADLLAPHVDFFSIGTNDLTQYTLAVDRVNERVSDLYQPTHPGVLRLIRQVVHAAHQVGVWVGLCGEMAGDVTVTPLLVGLGLDELSAAGALVAEVKHAVRKLNAVECQKLVETALGEADSAKILQATSDYAKAHYAELFEGS
ncbi:MAG: phosphoenolpyruvate--protein phosphotransferase [Roseimicrobium sp.]